MLLAYLIGHSPLTLTPVKPAEAQKIRQERVLLIEAGKIGECNPISIARRRWALKGMVLKGMVSTKLENAASKSRFTPASSNAKVRGSGNARITRVMKRRRVTSRNSAANTLGILNVSDQDELQLMDECNRPWVEAWERLCKLGKARGSEELKNGLPKFYSL